MAWARALLIPCRSPGEDAVAAGCTLVDGECACDMSRPRDAEVDACGGMA